MLARNLSRQADRVLFYDSNGGDYAGGVICDGIEQLKAYWPRVVDGSFKIVFRSHKPIADFPIVCEMVKACGGMTFVVDEVDMYFDKSEPPAEFLDIIRRGRREDVELIGITQRPRRMGELRSMVRELYIFETTEVMDLRHFREAYGDALVDKVRQLKEFEYVKVVLPYDESTLQIFKEEKIDDGYRTQICDCPAISNPAGDERPDGPANSEHDESKEEEIRDGQDGDGSVS